MPQYTLIALATVIVLGIGAQWLAWRFRMPSILLLLLTGVVAGPLTGFVDPDEIFGAALLPLVSLSVALILYEGGLSLRLSELTKVGSVVRNLLSVGALVTWLIAGWAAWAILGFDPRVAVLFGAILVVTGPTVIGPLLQQIRPTGRVAPILKWEGIAIDPLGAVLAVVVFDVVSVGHDVSPWAHGGLAVLRTVGVGGGLGLLVAALYVLLIKRFWVPDHLQNGVSLMLAVAVFAVSNHVQEEAGLLGVTVMGVALANQKWVTVEHIVEFKEDLRVLLIGTLFILLAARLKFDDIAQLGPEYIIFVVVLIVVARPLSVWLATIGAGLSWSERIFLSWMAPRGIVAAAVASVLALRLEDTGYEGAHLLVPATYVVVVGTVTVYGLTASAVARELGVAQLKPQGILIVGADQWVRAVAEQLVARHFRVLLVDTNRNHIAAARMSGLEAYHGSVLSDHFLDQVDLGGIGRMLAATPNDGVNVLALRRFSRLFGSASVYRLAPVPNKGGTRKTDAKGPKQDRLLFGTDMTHSVLQRRVAAGAVVKATPLTDTFNYQAYCDRYGQSHLPLFVIDKENHLSVMTANRPAAAQAWQTIVSLVDDTEENGATPA